MEKNHPENTDFSEKVRAGEVDIDSINNITQTTKTILKELALLPTKPSKIDVTFTAQQVSDGFQIWKERTSTSPNRQHLGLYKAWINTAETDTILPEHDFFKLLTMIINIT
eukprot:12828794-Ditylum_brightwellii.AAC.1